MTSCLDAPRDWAWRWSVPVCKLLLTLMIRSLPLKLNRHLYHGNFQKSWLLLKRAMSVAELLGYPQVARIVELNAVTMQDKDIIQADPKLAKGLIWEALLDLDKLCSTMLNLPSGSLRYEQPRQRPLVVNGEVRDRAYLSRLAGS